MGTPVPGPGKFSERTDKAVSAANRSLPDAGYGEQAAYQEQQSGAPMGAPAQNFAALFGDASANVTPLGADTTMPDVPVTDGADAGPGAGSEILSSSVDGARDQMRAYLPALEWMADVGNSDSARNLVRRVQSMV